MRKVIFSSDCGVDDSFAMVAALASNKLKVLGITTVFGNIDPVQASKNALYILDIMDKENIPVAIGSSNPLIGESFPIPPEIHGKYGLGSLVPKTEREALQDMSSSEFIVNSLRKSDEKITIIAIGPLTDVALALKIDPSITGNIEEIVIMGGAADINGNISPSSEANIYNDPLAAEIVFQSDVPCTMVGLDVTEKVIMDDDYISEVNKLGKAGRFLAEITDVFRKFHSDFFNVEGIFPHDLTAVYYAIDKSLFETYEAKIYVETAGPLKGLTYPYKKEIKQKNPDNWTKRKTSLVCAKVDTDRLLDEFKSLLNQ